MLCQRGKLVLHLAVFYLLFYFDMPSVQSSPVVEGGIVYEGEEHEDDKMTPELEVLLKKKRRFDCPMCDTSVFSYCSDKLLHDACCCLSPVENNLPHQCRFADCSFLHANSCQEHRLITACCCNNLAYAGTA